MKNKHPKLGIPPETRTITARTQIAKLYSELGISDLHRIPESYIAPSPRQQSCPAAADIPGWMRWSPEDGEGGLRRVLLPRPLVRRKATIKSTRMTWYSPLVKPIQTKQAKRRFLIKTNPISQTQPTLYAPAGSKYNLQASPIGESQNKQSKKAGASVPLGIGCPGF